MNVRSADSQDKERWNEFVCRFSDSPFHLYEWKKIFESVYGYECQYLIAEDQNEIVGIFPLAMMRSKLFGFRVCSLPFLDYGGPVFKLHNTNLLSCLRSFLNYFSCYTCKADYLEVRSPIQVETSRCLKTIFIPGNVKYLSFLINLNRSFDEIWQKDFDSDLRKKIRKATKHNINVVEQNFEEVLDEFYYGYLRAMKRLGSPPHKMEFFGALPKMLGKKRVKFFPIAMADKLIGGAIVFVGNSTMYYGYEVIDPKYRNLRPTYLLYSEMLKWGCENGFRVFDTGRTLYGSGVYLFKKQWGGKERFLPYYYIGKKIPREDPRERYSLLSKLWSKLLPLSFTPKIGWRIKAGVGH